MPVDRAHPTGDASARNGSSGKTQSGREFTAYLHDIPGWKEVMDVAYVPADVDIASLFAEAGRRGVQAIFVDPSLAHLPDAAPSPLTSPPTSPAPPASSSTASPQAPGQLNKAYRAAKKKHKKMAGAAGESRACNGRLHVYRLRQGLEAKAHSPSV
ncbi:hypothetical protein OF83DRAFT_1176116, partial [Amylostereum chailletii]